MLTKSEDRPVRRDAPLGKPRPLLTRRKGKTTRLWDVVSGKLLAVWPEDLGSSVVFSPDSRIVLTRGTFLGKALLWDVVSGKLLAVLKHEGQVRSAVFSPNGHLVLTGSEDKTARLWEAASGKPLAVLKHEGLIDSARFSPDGRTVITRCEDRTAWFWAINSGVSFAVLRHPDTLPVVSVSPNGRTVMIKGSEGKIQLWELPPLAPDDEPLLRAWVAVRSGKALDERGILRGLSPDEWQKAWERLEASGGEWDRPPSSRHWHLSQAADAEGEKSWFGAAFHLEKLLQETPEDLDLRYRLARVNLNLRRWGEAAAGLTLVIKHRPEDADALNLRGLASAELGQWKEAIADFKEVVRLRPNEVVGRSHLAIAQLGAGNEAGYRDVCRDMVSRFRDTRDAKVAWQVASHATHLPNAVADPEILVALAKRAHATRPDSANLYALGTTLFRSGRFAEAIPRLQEAASKAERGPTSGMALFLAMAHHRLAQHADPTAVFGSLAAPAPLLAAAAPGAHAIAARHWLGRADELMRAEPPANWQVRVLRQVLRAEAGRLLGEQAPAKQPRP